MSDADILFKVTKHFIPGDEVGFAWNSSEIGIQWPDIGMDYIMNANDKSNCDFSELKL